MQTTKKILVRDKNFWKIIERTKCGPKGGGQEARNKNAKDAKSAKLFSYVFALFALFALFAFFADKKHI